MGRYLRIYLPALLALCSYAQTELFEIQEWTSGEAEMFRGAALTGSGNLYTWGDRLLRWNTRNGKADVLVKEGPGFGRGGCLADVDQDGLDDMVLLEQSPSGGLGKLVWFHAPRWERRVIDTGAEFRDCSAATLHGRRGVVLIHRYLQLRFYEIPDDSNQPWTYRELYSIYTPSRQGGLLLADVDDDGHSDILFGNYWLRNPAGTQAHWRLFAINLWSEKPESALSTLVLESITGGAFPDLLAAQSDMGEARLAVFQRPDSPSKLWPQQRLEAMLGLRYPSALAAGDLDEDSHSDILVGENNGVGSRLILFYNQGGSKFLPSMVAETRGLIHVWITDVDADGDRDIVGLGPTSVGCWRSQLRR